MKKKLRCPKCHREQLARIARHGLLRKYLFHVFGFYPWECGICRRQFLLRNRGLVYRSSSRRGSKPDAATSALNSETY